MAKACLKEKTMDAQIKKITIVPPKLDKEGFQITQETATITLAVPIDTGIQKEAVKALFDILSKEWVKVEITAQQQTLKITETLDAAKGVELNANEKVSAGMDAVG